MPTEPSFPEQRETHPINVNNRGSGLRAMLQDRFQHPRDSNRRYKDLGPGQNRRRLLGHTHSTVPTRNSILHRHPKVLWLTTNKEQSKC